MHVQLLRVKSRLLRKKNPVTKPTTVGVVGSGCGSTGRAVDSRTRDPRFETSDWQILFTINCIENTNVKQKEAVNNPMKNISLHQQRAFGTSVTRWLDHMFNIGPFATTKVCPIVQFFCQSRFKILTNRY